MLMSKKKIPYLSIIAQIDKKVNILNKSSVQNVVNFTIHRFVDDQDNKFSTELRLK